MFLKKWNQIINHIFITVSYGELLMVEIKQKNATFEIVSRMYTTLFYVYCNGNINIYSARSIILAKNIVNRNKMHWINYRLEKSNILRVINERNDENSDNGIGVVYNIMIDIHFSMSVNKLRSAYVFIMESKSYR